MIRLYGQGAVQFSDGRGTYMTNNGVLDIPESLENRAKELGFSRIAPPVEEVAAEIPAAPAGDAGEGEKSDAPAETSTSNDAPVNDTPAEIPAAAPVVEETPAAPAAPITHDAAIALVATEEAKLVAELVSAGAAQDEAEAMVYGDRRAVDRAEG